MTPENQPEKGIAKRAYGIVKGAGHTFKRATLGDIYALIDQRADEAKQHREENFRYLNTRIDTQIGEVRKEISAVNQRVDSLGQKIDTQVGQLRQEMNSRMDAFDQKINSRMDRLDEKLDGIIKLLMTSQQKSQ